MPNSNKQLTNQQLAVSVEQRMADVVRNDVIEKTDLFYDALVVNAEPTAKLPEAVFVEHFLPYFSGEKPMTRENKVMENWVSISGTPTNEVAIIGTNNEVLFKVPAVFDTNLMDVTNRNASVAMANIYSGFSMRNNNLPVIANNYLAGALTEKQSELLSSEGAKTETERRWTSIMARYNKAGQSASGSSAPAQTPDDDVEYD